MDKVIIYENEALLFKDQLKADLRKLYKNVNIQIALATSNLLLEGVHVTVNVVNIKGGLSKYISTSGLFNYKDYYDYILCTIKDMLQKIFIDYITNNEE